MKNESDQQIHLIPIEQIRVLNPRFRDKKKFQAIVSLIDNQGISVSTAFDLGQLAERLMVSLFWDAGREKTRMDALSKAMWKTMLEFQRKHDRLPTAKELWKKLPIGKYVQEKDEEDLSIYWRDGTGLEKTAIFHNFEKRLTNLKKKFKKNHP